MSQFPLWFHELIHFSLSTLAAFLVWFFLAKRRLAFWKLWLSALFLGFFIDADHIFDHFFAYGIKGFFEHGLLSFFMASRANPFAETQKVYVLFHGWEYLFTGLFFLLWAKIKNHYQLFLITFSALFSYFFHLLFDQLCWAGTPWAYSLIYRVTTHFSLIRF